MSRHVSNDLKARAKALAAREGIPYSAALARLRTSRSAAKPALAVTLPEYLYIPFPAPELGDAEPCEPCAGSGLSGLTWAMESDGGRPPLLVEGVCGHCGGCGRAEHDEESGCGVLHAGADEDDDWDQDDWDTPDPECLSCHDRGFNYVQGFTRDDLGEPDEVVYTRTPCGCTADRARVITGDAVEVMA